MSFQPDHFAVWTEIPANDLDKAMGFYNAVLQVELEKEQMGPNDVAVFKTKDPRMGVSGNIYKGKPAGDGSGPTIHLATPGKLEETLDRVRAAGGKVVSDPIDIPEGRFAYCLDLDGNSISMFEA